MAIHCRLVVTKFCGREEEKLSDLFVVQVKD
jgi:hypothetical protein